MVAPLSGEEKLPNFVQDRIDKVIRLAKEFDCLEVENAPMEAFLELEKEYDDSNPNLKMTWIPKPLLLKLGKIQTIDPRRMQVPMQERRKSILEIVEKCGRVNKHALARELHIGLDSIDGYTRPLIHAKQIRYLHGFYKLVQPELILDEDEEVAYAPERMMP